MNRHNTTMVQLAIILVIRLAATGSNLHAAAQESSNKPKDKASLAELPIEQVVKRASELIRKLRLQVENEERYVKQLKTASEEDRRVLDLQLVTVRREIINDVFMLTDLLLKLEQKTPQPELRNKRHMSKVC